MKRFYKNIQEARDHIPKQDVQIIVDDWSTETENKTEPNTFGPRNEK